ncbi:MAG: bacteriohemerythrin [Geothrix sp.]|nr:bacteriohemerythrin [Geothrix sp.]
MAHIQWKDRYSIHFREIDAQHRGLLDLLNELIDLLGDRCDPQPVARIFHALCDYALTHFSSEERYMQAAGYPKLEEHRQEHAAFVARVLELSQAYDPGDPQLVDQTLEFLKHWYLDHIIKSDQDYAPFLQRALPTASIQGILFGLEGVICTRDLDPVPAMLQLAGRLKAHQPVALVGDAPPWMRTQDFAHLVIEGHSDAEDLPGEAGARPPDPALFLAAAAQLGLAPETCLLIHRDPACLDAAQAGKLQTLHHTNPVMLMAELRRMAVPF